MSRWQSYDHFKNTFPFPNEVFLLGLCSGELAVYAFLLCSANRKTQQCWPSYKMIGKAVGMSKNTVAKYVSRLESKGLICTEPTTVITKTEKKRNGNLMYTILPISEAVEIYHARRLAAMNAETAHQETMRRIEEYNRKHPDDPVLVTDNRSVPAT